MWDLSIVFICVQKHTPISFVVYLVNVWRRGIFCFSLMDFNFKMSSASSVLRSASLVLLLLNTNHSTYELSCSQNNLAASTAFQEYRSTRYASYLALSLIQQKPELPTPKQWILAKLAVQAVEICQSLNHKNFIVPSEMAKNVQYYWY
jgi:hypothetical protein